MKNTNATLPAHQPPTTHYCVICGEDKTGDFFCSDNENMICADCNTRKEDDLADFYAECYEGA